MAYRQVGNEIRITHSFARLLVCSVLLLGATAMSNENLLNTNAFARSLSARIIYFHYVWPCECVSVCVWTISILHLLYECGFRFHDAWFIETYTVLRIRQFAFLMSAAYTHTIFCIHISEIRQFFGEQNTNTRTIKANVFSFKCFAIWMRNWKLCAKREREREYKLDLGERKWEWECESKWEIWMQRARNETIEQLFPYKMQPLFSLCLCMCVFAGYSVPAYCLIYGCLFAYARTCMRIYVCVRV